MSKTVESGAVYGNLRDRIEQHEANNHVCALVVFVDPECNLYVEGVMLPDRSARLDFSEQIGGAVADWMKEMQKREVN